MKKLLLLSMCFFSCCEKIENTPTKKSKAGISYKIVEIEGKRFIATQTHNGYWTLANLD